jgi:hypothetical protein
MKRGTMLGLYLKSSILPCETITGRMLLGGGVIKKLSAGRLLHDLKVSWNLHHVTSAKGIIYAMWLSLTDLSSILWWRENHGGYFHTGILIGPHGMISYQKKSPSESLL